MKSSGSEGRARLANLLVLCWATDDHYGEIMPWILSEDEAMKIKLQGLTVTDPNSGQNGRKVLVRYRLPENELANLDFPIIIIEHANIARDPDREHSGYVQLPYAPEGYETWWPDNATSYDPNKSPYYAMHPVPMNIDYQITVLARKALHLMPIVSDLAQIDRLPPRFGYLDIPQDKTIRSLWNMGGPDLGEVDLSYGNDEDGKRLHRASYLVRIPTELLPSQVDDITQVLTVSQVNIDLGVYEDTTDIDTKIYEETFGSAGVRSNINWNINS